MAYLAPEIPALSATFVYEELLALARAGVRVSAYSVHQPKAAAKEQADLLANTVVLYRQAKPLLLVMGCLKALVQPGFGRALGWLMQDVWALGVWRPRTWKLLLQFAAAAGMADQMRKSGVQHVHIHFAHVPAQVGMYAAAMAGLPFTITSHANDIFERGQLLKVKAQRARFFLTVSDFNKSYLKGLGLPVAKLGVVRCGVSFATPKQLPTATNKPVYTLGTLGRLVEKKGVDVLLRAVANMLAQGHAVRLQVAGDGPLAADLQQMARDLQIQNQVEWLGALRHDQVGPWMNGLDAFVLACKVDAHGDMDGIPVVLMEAMSQGVPVVSTRLSGIPELVLDGVTGVLAEPDNAPDLAQKISDLLSAPEKRQHMLEAAAQHVQNEFGQSVNVQRLLDYFDRAGEGGGV